MAIRYYRKRIGISQEALAVRSGLHRTYVGGIERGERNPSLLKLVSLANALEVKLSEVMARFEGEMGRG